MVNVIRMFPGVASAQLGVVFDEQACRGTSGAPRMEWRSFPGTLFALPSHWLKEAAMKSLAAAALTACVFLFSAGLMAVTVTAEMVSEPLNASAVESSLETCIEGEKHPDIVKLVMLVGKDGSMRWSRSAPASR